MATWDLEALITTAILITAVNIITLLGNAFVIVTLCKIDVLNNTANSQLVISLALADFFVGFLVMPCAIDSFLAGRWRCGAIWGQMNAFGNFWFCISSIVHLAVLSVDRYYAILHPLTYQSLVTKRRARMACFLSWVYGMVWALPPIFGISSYECFIPYIGKCLGETWLQNQSEMAFALSVVSATYGLAVVIMIFTYWKIFLTIRAQTKRIAAGVEHEHTGPAVMRNALSAKKGAFTIFIIIGTYIICWSPFCVLLFVQITHGKSPQDLTAEKITMFIGFANSACNPVIYCLRYRRFRKCVKRMLQKTNSCCKNVLFLQSPQRMYSSTS